MRFYWILLATFLLTVFSYGQKPELVLPLGHTAAITAADFSYDGKYMLSGSLDQQVKIWQLTGELVRTIDDFEKPVLQLAASPTAYNFVTVTENNLVLYDFEGNTHFTMSRGRDPRFSPDGNYLLFKVGIYTPGSYAYWQRDEYYFLNLQTLEYSPFPVNTTSVQFSEIDHHAYCWDGRHLLSFHFDTKLTDTLYDGYLTAAFYQTPSTYASNPYSTADNPFPSFWVKESDNQLILFGENNSILAIALDKPNNEYVEIRSAEITDTSAINSINTYTNSNQKNSTVIPAHHGDFVVRANAGKCEILTISDGRIIARASVLIDNSSSFYPVSLSDNDKYLLLQSTIEESIYVYDLLQKKLIAQRLIIPSSFPSIEKYTISKGLSWIDDGLLIGHNSGLLERYHFLDDLQQVYATEHLNFIHKLEIEEKFDDQVAHFYLFPGKEANAGGTSGLMEGAQTTLLYQLLPENNQLSCYRNNASYTDILSNKSFSEETVKQYPMLTADQEIPQETMTGSNPISTPVALNQSGILSTLLFDDSDELILFAREYEGLKIKEKSGRSVPFIDIGISSFNDVMINHDKLLVIENAYSCTCEDVDLMMWDMNCVWERRIQLNEKLATLKFDTSLLSNPYFSVKQYLYSLTQVDCQGRKFKIAPCSKFLNYSAERNEILATNKGKLLVLNTTDGKTRELIGHRIDILGASYFNEGKYIVSWSSDHTIKFWNAHTGENLLTYLLIGQEDWVATSANGLFDASPGAMRKLYYSVGLELVDIEQLKERYYEPGLITKVLGYSSESIRTVSGLNHLELYPELEASLENDTLFVQLKNRGGGIGKVSIFINGKEVIEDANPKGADGNRDTDFQLAVQPFYKYLLSHPDSVNHISLRAYNEAGWLKSKPISFQIEGKAHKGLQLDGNFSNWKASERPSFYAVIIGTQDYRGKELDLAYADKDATAMARAIQQTATNLFVDEEIGDTTHIRCLTTTPADSLLLADKGIQWRLPSKQNIREVFDEITREAKAEDVILVYFSGHGVTYGNADNSLFYYLTKDIANANISDNGIRENYAVSSQEITTWLNRIPALKQVLIIDACSSGQVVEGLNNSTKSLNSDQIRAIDRMKDRTGIYVISGSASDKVSYEAGQYGQSLLTYALLKGMIGAATTEVEQSKFIDVMTLLQYARNEVPALASSINGIQTPMLGFPTNAASFDIGILDQSLDIELSAVKPVVIRSVMMNKESLIDELGLTSKLESGLEEESAQGYQADYIYVPTNNYPGAYSLRGLYAVNKNGEIVLTAKLIQENTLVATFEVPRTTNVQHIVKYLKRSLHKFLDN